MKMQITSFYGFWDFFCREASERGYNQTEFMKVCGLPNTRYNSFTKGEMELTAYYVSKIMEGLRIREDYVEKKSGKKFTDQQREALGRIAWTNSNEDILNALMKSKSLTKEVKDLIAKKKYVKKLVYKITHM
jgi:hypothetical protein